MTPRFLAPMLLLAAVTTGCSGGDGRGRGRDRDCSDDLDCPAIAPYCCEGTFDGGGDACHQWLFGYEGDSYCVNDECERDRDCPGDRPFCCSFEADAGVPYKECVRNETSFGACFN